MRTEMMTLVLPQPPSADRYWRRHGRTIYLSAEARAFKRAVYAAACWATGYSGPLIRPRLDPLFPTEDVIVYAAWFRAAKRGDLDNFCGKALLDALQGVAYTNDRQVAALVAWRVDGGAPRAVDSSSPPDYAQAFFGIPRLEIRVQPWAIKEISGSTLEEFRPGAEESQQPARARISRS